MDNIEKIARLRHGEREGNIKWLPWEDLTNRQRNYYLDRARPVLQAILSDPNIVEKTSKVICLCGSTRFTEQMLVKQWELTKQGNVVLSWCALPDSYFQGKDKAHIGDQEGVKSIVDEVHFRKIDLADEVIVLNIDGYIGESTSNEIAYAKSKSKTITYIERLAG